MLRKFPVQEEVFARKIQWELCKTSLFFKIDATTGSFLYRVCGFISQTWGIITTCNLKIKFKADLIWVKKNYKELRHFLKLGFKNIEKEYNFMVFFSPFSFLKTSSSRLRPVFMRRVTEYFICIVTISHKMLYPS